MLAGAAVTGRLPNLTLRFRAGWMLVRELMLSRLSRRHRLLRRNRRAFYRRLWAAAAAGVGAGVRELADGGLEIETASGPVQVRGIRCSIDDQAALDRAGDKTLVYRLLAADALPVPVHRVFTLATLVDARRALAEAPGPCVVKPARHGAGGRGVTTGVRTETDLSRAVIAAAVAGARGGSGGGSLATRLIRALGILGDAPLLIEHQAIGQEYRLLYLDGVLLDALRREPPSVTGDGRHSVAELLAAANTARLRSGAAHGIIGRNLEFTATLAGQGLTADSVPDPGVVVRVKTAINENAPESNFPAGGEVCETLVRQGARAAELVGARLVGVDVITADPSVGLGAGGGVLLEVNATPGLVIHHHGHEGGVDPAVEVLRRLAAPSPAS